jgi:hypothetical protein
MRLAASFRLFFKRFEGTPLFPSSPAILSSGVFLRTSRAPVRHENNRFQPDNANANLSP